MKGAAERPQRRLLHRLAERRMRMEGAGHILQPRAHLYGEPERRRKLGHALADSLHAEDQVIVGAGDDPHEAVRALQGRDALPI